MRIVVDDIAASKTGALSVLRDFYNAVTEYEGSKAGSSNEWIFVLGDKLLEETDNVKVIVRDDVKSSRKERLMFDLKSGAGFFESLKPDVLFSLQNTLPRGYKGKQILYVHQPLPYQTWKNFSFFKAEEREYAVYQHLIGRMIDASVKRADKVIVQTQWMKDAVVRKTGAADDKVVKILPDVSVGHGDGSSVFMQPRNSAVLTKGMKTEEPSPCLHNRFFYPAGEILYKNHECILKAAGLLKERGINDFEVSFTLNKGDVPGLDKYPDHEQVKYLGRIPREEVFKRYSSEILLFASYIETFGYPLAEARAVGGRIIASDCPFSHEILDGYERAVFFDPFDPGKLADIMEQSILGNLFSDLEGKTDQLNNVESSGSGWDKIIDLIINI